MNEHLVIALSGGVDSSVAALLLKQQGYDVSALFMKNWEEDDRDGQCNAAEDLQDAQRICEKLDIPLHSVNFSSEYWDNVFTHFLAEYRAGRTPNPDVLCNREIKFKTFLEHAQRLGGKLMATGHYARIQQSGGEFFLLKGRDANKDQSYFLYMLGQKQLATALFPIGGMEKSTVRDLARQHGLITHAKKDSTGICFIGERRFSTFLQRFIPKNQGSIVSPEGKILGEHHGLSYYTIGQRQGLGIGGHAGGTGEAWYVADKDLSRNELIVVQGGEHPLLFKPSLQVTDLHWISGNQPALPLSCQAKIRYRQTDQACCLEDMEDRYRVTFEQPQRAVTPGQSIVFYQGDQCLGGGIIAS